MINAFKAEIIKLKSLRNTWVYFFLLAATFALPVSIISFVPSESPSQLGWADFMVTKDIFLLIAFIFGASTVAGDIGQRMVAHSFLTQKSRHQWLIAKGLVIVLFIELCMWIGVGIGCLVTNIAPNGTWTGGDTYNLVLVAWTMPLFTLMAAGLAAITRSKLAGAGLMFALYFIIEQMLLAFADKFAFVEALTKILPGLRVNDLMKHHSGGMEGFGMDPQVAPALCVVIIIAWAVALFGGGLVANKVRDVK